MKRLFNILVLFFATVLATAQSQKSFVVADKDGNSPLVESLIFQKDASDEKFSWKTSMEGDGYQASRDIRNLKFIARTNVELQTADSDDIFSVLEEESGKDGVDAEAIATSLKDNPNVDEAYTEDGGNLILKLKDEEEINVFPMYEINDIFNDSEDSYAPIFHAPQQPDAFRASANIGKVAIFNFFSGDNSVKDKLAGKVEELFKKHQYSVELYSRHSGKTPNINEFTVKNLNYVINHSSEYDAIIIFSHGFVIGGKSYFATGEVTKDPATTYPSPHVVWIDSQRYITYPSSFKLDPNCLVYIGSCYGVWNEGDSSNHYAKNATIGWKGKNSVAQTHATVLFDKILNRWGGIGDTFIHDPFSPEAERYMSPLAQKMCFTVSSLPDYLDDVIMTLKARDHLYQRAYHDIFIKKCSRPTGFGLNGHITGKKMAEYPQFVRVQIEPVIQFGGGSVPDARTVAIKKNDPNSVYENVDYVTEPTYILWDPNTPEGIYRINVQALMINGSRKWVNIRQRSPMYVIYSSKLDDNYALPAWSDEDNQFPEIQDAGGARVEDVELAAGTTKEFTIFGYPGHTFYPTVMNSDIAQLSIDGNRLTVTGVSEGKTYARVTDLDNKLFFIFDVTVTKGGDVSPTEGLVAYYPFNGNANDESGCGNHGVPTENVVLDTGLNGDSNGAYRFGGYDNPGHIFVANSESLQFSEGATFSVYVKPTSWLSMDGWGYRTDKNGAQCIIAKEHDRRGITFVLAGDEEKCNVWMQSMAGEPWAALETEEKLIGNYLNKWMHLAFVYGNGYARLYVNGQLVDERESTPDFSRVNNQNMYIGKFSDYWYPFNGLIDEVRIYNRALDLDEVRTLANYKTQ